MTVEVLFVADCPSHALAVKRLRDVLATEGILADVREVLVSDERIAMRILGFYDGIRVGANANAQSNVLVNIFSDTTQPTCHPNCFVPIHVVHIYNVNTSLVSMGVVSPSEGNPTVGHGQESRVGDGNAVSIAREIGQDLRGSSKGSLGIYDPVAMRGGA